MNKLTFVLIVSCILQINCASLNVPEGTTIQVPPLLNYIMQNARPPTGSSSLLTQDTSSYGSVPPQPSPPQQPLSYGSVPTPPPQPPTLPLRSSSYGSMDTSSYGSSSYGSSLLVQAPAPTPQVWNPEDLPRQAPAPGPQVWNPEDLPRQAPAPGPQVWNPEDLPRQAPGPSPQYMYQTELPRQAPGPSYGGLRSKLKIPQVTLPKLSDLQPSYGSQQVMETQETPSYGSMPPLPPVRTSDTPSYGSMPTPPPQPPSPPVRTLETPSYGSMPTPPPQPPSPPVRTLETPSSYGSVPVRESSSYGSSLLVQAPAPTPQVWNPDEIPRQAPAPTPQVWNPDELPRQAPAPRPQVWNPDELPRQAPGPVAYNTAVQSSYGNQQVMASQDTSSYGSVPTPPPFRTQETPTYGSNPQVPMGLRTTYGSVPTPQRTEETPSYGSVPQLTMDTPSSSYGSVPTPPPFRTQETPTYGSNPQVPMGLRTTYGSVPTPQRTEETPSTSYGSSLQSTRLVPDGYTIQTQDSTGIQPLSYSAPSYGPPSPSYGNGLGSGLRIGYAAEYNYMCSNPGYFKHPGSDNMFIQCDDNYYAFQMPCPPYLVFDPYIQVCNWPSYSGQSYGGSSYGGY